MPKISQIDAVPCQAEVRILQKITLNVYCSLRVAAPSLRQGEGTAKRRLNVLFLSAQRGLDG